MIFSYALLQIYNQLKFYMDADPAILGGQFDNFTYKKYLYSYEFDSSGEGYELSLTRQYLILHRLLSSGKLRIWNKI